jgi:hypothetical protein
MTDTTKLMEQTERGRRSAMVLEDLDTAFDALEEQCFDTFKGAPIHDNDGMLACRLYMKVLSDVKDRFELFVTTGEIARKDLARLSKEEDDG